MGSTRDNDEVSSVLQLFICLLTSPKANADSDGDDDDDNDTNKNNSIKFLTHLRYEPNSQGPITESARIQNNK
jgi:hypothetical protein